MTETATRQANEVAPWVTPEAVARRARASHTACEVVERRTHVVAYWAVWTTPEGEVADRVWRYGEVPSPPWAGYEDESEGLAAWLSQPTRRTA